MSVIVAEMNSEGFWRILCPREEKKIPIYHCIGGFVKSEVTCGSMQNATVSLDGARCKCLWPEKRRET